MDGLSIGDKVIVAATANWKYIDSPEGKRRMWYAKPIKQREAWYVGYTWKEEGLYKEGTSEYNTFGSVCDELPHLTNIKSIKLMRVKFLEWGNDKFAFRQHLTKMKGK